MNIILAEERPGQPATELSFDKPSVIAGRNAAECDISYERERFPMVSRRHAEIRCVGGGWMAADLGSSYGTFVNGERIAGPTKLRAGSIIQLGTDGPRLHVIWFEAPADEAEGEAAEWEVAPEPQTPPPPKKPVMSTVVERPIATAEPPRSAAKSPAARLEFNDKNRKPLTLSGQEVTFGRDPICTVVFDAGSATVSRNHALLRSDGGHYVIVDNNSFNGTLINGHRISGQAPLHDGDEIQLGLGGPVIRFVSGDAGSGPRPPEPKPVTATKPTPTFDKTLVVQMGESPVDRAASGEPELVKTASFEGRDKLTVGRGADCDITLDGLQISNLHAILKLASGGVAVDDAGSTNGTFINGERISRGTAGPEDEVRIGSFVLRPDGSGRVSVFDTRSKTRVDVEGLTVNAKGRFGRKGQNLLDNVSIAVEPNEFIGVLGPSGAGKSTLIEAMCGAASPAAGRVLVNGQELYRNLDLLRQSIGYVPQDDIIHQELSVYRTLFYVAKLRLSNDLSTSEIRGLIDEVLDVTGLADRRDIAVNRLSGGQRKRVSIAVELVTKPSLLYLDEPTSGLDPATSARFMQLFRQIAESGRTVVMTTHEVDNIGLFDKIALLVDGRLAFFGKPAEALEFFKAESFTKLFEKIAPSSTDAGEAVSRDLSERFAASPFSEEYRSPGADAQYSKSGTARKRRLGLFGSIRQWFTLSRRYFELLLKDKTNLLIVVAQAPIIALMTFIVTSGDEPRDFVYFAVSLVAVWFGTSLAAREIVKERPVYRRERMFNLGIFPYLFSKLFVLGFIVALQCVLMFVPLKVLDLAGLMSMPGELFGIPQFWAMLLTAAVGLATGLFVSTAARTQAAAASIVPLILIPQILFSGLMGVPGGISKVVSMTMPSAWSFDTMKRFSTLDTLEPEGADPDGPTEGLGLYKFVESENDRLIERAKQDVEDYKRVGGDGLNNTSLDEKLKVPETERIPDDLSRYVTFLHPWMHEVLNQLVLMLMFGFLVIATLVALKIKDIK